MKKFKGFSDAAQLYASNLGVVAAMQELLEHEIGNFLDTLAERVQDQINSTAFQRNLSRGSRYWWISEEGEDSSKSTRLWFAAHPSEILTAKELLLHVQPPGKPPERIDEVKQLVGKDGLGFLQISVADYSVIDATIECDDTDLDNPARQVAALLLELNRIDQKTRQTQ